MSLCHSRGAKRYSGFAIEPDLCLIRVPIRARPIRGQGAHKSRAHKGPGGPTRAQLIRVRGAREAHRRQQDENTSTTMWETTRNKTRGNNMFPGPTGGYGRQ